MNAARLWALDQTSGPVHLRRPFAITTIGVPAVTLLFIRSLIKTFLGTRVRDGVHLDLRAGKVHGHLGESGSGRPILVNCLICLCNRCTVLLEGHKSAPRSTLKAQNLMFGRKAMLLLTQYGLDLHVKRDLCSYPVAIRGIVAIACAVALSGKAHILGEPTATLDAVKIRAVFDAVRSRREPGLGIIFVSHFLNQIFDPTCRAAALHNGQHVTPKDTESIDRMRLIGHVRGPRLGDDVLHSCPSDLNPRRDKPNLRSFGRPSVSEVVAFAGLPGAHRTKAAEALSGLRPANTGEAPGLAGRLDVITPRKAITAGFGFAPGNCKTDGIVADLSMRENIFADREQRIGDLSGENQKKSVPARWPAMNPCFSFLGEPTCGIDVGVHAKMPHRMIHELVAMGTLLNILSELDELVAVSGQLIMRAIVSTVPSDNEVTCA